jgi:hypothetical protein
MTRTLQERPGLPGRARHDPLDNREHVIRTCAKLADALLRGCASAAHPSSSPADLERAASPDRSASRCGAPRLTPRVEVIPPRGTEKSPVNLHNPPAGTIRASRRPGLMYAHKDQDSTSALTPSLPSHQSRVAAFARDSRHCGQVAAIRQTTAGRGGRSVSTSARRVGPGPGDPGSTPGRRPAESCRTEQLPPATQVRVRGSQIEVDRVQP